MVDVISYLAAELPPLWCQSQFNLAQPSAHIVKSKSNTYILNNFQNAQKYWLSVPLENDLLDDILDVTNKLNVNFDMNVGLYAWHSSLIGSVIEDCDPSNVRSYVALEQKLFSTDYYSQRLERFKNKKWSFQSLDESNKAELLYLSFTWRKNRMEFINRSLFSKPLPSLSELDYATLKAIDPLKIAQTFHNPTTQWFGCFEYDNLLAASSVESAGEYCAIKHRCSVRRNSHSPQEFLDLNVFRHLSTIGKQSIDRGCEPKNSPRAQTLGLYKTKFGTLKKYEIVNICNLPKEVNLLDSPTIESVPIHSNSRLISSKQENGL